jgi:hypothetical protein
MEGENALAFYRLIVPLQGVETGHLKTVSPLASRIPMAIGALS